MMDDKTGQNNENMENKATNNNQNHTNGPSLSNSLERIRRGKGKGLNNSNGNSLRERLNNRNPYRSNNPVNPGNSGNNPSSENDDNSKKNNDDNPEKESPEEKKNNPLARAGAAFGGFGRGLNNARNVLNDPGQAAKDVAKGTIKKAAKAMPLKYKLIIGGIILAFFFLIIIIVAIGNFLGLDINFSGELFSENNTSYWWPVGSNETTVIDNITFANGAPSTVAVTSNFSLYRCIGGSCNPHYGIDIGGGSAGTTNIIAVLDGVVEKVSNGCPTYGAISGAESNCGGQLGNYVYIKHSDGNYTKYAHMAIDTVTVKVGDTVKQGQVIGKMGSSGRSTGVHLHFQLEVGGLGSSFAVDPLTYISAENPRTVVGGSKVNEASGPLGEDNLLLYNGFVLDKEGGNTDKFVCTVSSGPAVGESGYKVFDAEGKGTIKSIAYGLTDAILGSIDESCFSNSNYAYYYKKENFQYGTCIPEKSLTGALYCSAKLEVDNPQNSFKKYCGNDFDMLTEFKVNEVHAIMDFAHGGIGYADKAIKSYCDEYNTSHDKNASVDAYFKKVFLIGSGNRYKDVICPYIKRRECEADLFFNSNYACSIKSTSFTYKYQKYHDTAYNCS